MNIKYVAIVLIQLTLASASLFDFFHHQQGDPRADNSEIQKLSVNCNEYLCPDTGICVKEPKFCPCPFPSSELRCFLPNGNYLCISKPAGFYDKYDDPATNWKVDAKDDEIRDCGWVSRHFKG